MSSSFTKIDPRVVDGLRPMRFQPTRDHREFGGCFIKGRSINAHREVGCEARVQRLAPQAAMVVACSGKTSKNPLCICPEKG